MTAQPLAAAAGPGGMFEAPSYVTPDGRASEDPLQLSGRDPVVDLAGLALMLSSPALELEFMPASLWRGLTLRRPGLPLAAHGSDPAGLCDQFRASVERCIGESGTVAVFFSGGLDSLAVLLHARAIAASQGRRVVAVTVDLVDDLGVPTAPAAARLIAELAGGTELVVVSADPGGRPDPPWRAHGPWLRGLPRLNRAANDAALTMGADVMLNGNGGDELFMTRDYLAGPLARAGRWRDLVRYARDVCRYYGWLTGAAREAAALLAPALGPKRSFQLYTALQQPSLAEPGALGLLDPALRPAVAAFWRSWLERQAELFAACPGADAWCRALARDMAWPLDPAPAYGPVPECSPFMDPAFAGYAMGLPLAATFSAHYAAPYHRHKALVAGLTRSEADRLPAGKQQFGRAVRDYAARIMAERPLIGTRHGLFTPAATSLLDHDPRLGPMCWAMDTWLEGALDYGATIG